jgi:two-component system response regulator
VVRLILLIEDNDDDADLTAMAFRAVQIDNALVRVRDGVEALEYLKTEQPALILLDLNLPRLDGFGVLRAIRADAAHKYLPVVILTSSDEDHDRIAAYDGHANSFIRKPVDYDQFQRAAQTIAHYWLVLNRPAPVLRGA